MECVLLCTFEQLETVIYPTACPTQLPTLAFAFTRTSNSGAGMSFAPTLLPGTSRGLHIFSEDERRSAPMRNVSIC
jgi:hypothetical protein